MSNMSHFTLGVIVNRLDDVERVMNKYIIDTCNLRKFFN